MPRLCRKQLRAAWSTISDHPQIVPFMFYTRAMTPSARYAIHDLVSGLAANKQLTPLALSWTYNGTRVVDLLLDGGADATAHLLAAGCAHTQRKAERR